MKRLIENILASYICNENSQIKWDLFYYEIQKFMIKYTQILTKYRKNDSVIDRINQNL